jgi:hypothetical protein
MESGPQGAPENSRAAAIAGPGRLTADRPLEGRGAVLSDPKGSIRASAATARAPAASPSGYAASAMKRATSCGAS